MKINVQHLLNEYDQSIEEYIQRGLLLALSKVAANISSITFCMTNVMGKNGKNETHFLLTLSLYQRPNIVVEETQPNLYFGIDRVIQKASRTVSRKLLS